MATFTPTTNPMSITSAATVVASRPFLVKKMEWLTPVTIGDKVIVADLGGNMIMAGTCEVASQSQILWSGVGKLTLPGKATATASWQVSTINSGSLLIWWQ
jgi:hypothetical protein